MKLVVGLGNPGKEYEETKHNVGFWVIDAFARRHHIPLSEEKGEAQVGRSRWSGPGGPIDFLLVKPQAFMNRSGRSVQRLLDIFQIPFSNLIVIFDDLDLECGRVRLRTKGGSGGHRGVDSVIGEIGSEEFLRLKIGIGRDPQCDPVDYVLSPFHPADKKLVLGGVEKGVAMLPLLLEGRIAEAMNRYHSEPPSP